MTESNPPTSEQPPAPPAPPAAVPPKKRRWLRRMAWLFVGLLLLGVTLVALLPTLAGLTPVRTFALEQAQSLIPHGKLDVAGWSVGWFSPIRVHGVKLYDDRGQVVLEADEVKTNLTLMQAIRQQFDLSGTVIDAAAYVVVYPNGKTNLHRVLGLDEPRPAETKVDRPTTPQPRPSETQAAKLPDLKGDITLKLRGDVRTVDGGDVTTARVRLLAGSGGTVKIANINQPIDADLVFLYDTGDATRAGRVGVKSSFDAIEANQLDLARLAATLDLPVKDVDLAGLRPLLAMAGLHDVHLAGILSGQVAGELKPGQAGSIKGRMSVANFEAGTPQLKDTYRAAIVDVPISLSRVVVSGASRLQLDTGITMPESAVRVTGDLPEPALARLASKQMAGDSGALGVSLSSDLRKLAAALPNTIRLLPGVSVERGALASDITLTLRPDTIQTHVKTDVSVQGAQNGRPIAIEPITFTSDATLTQLGNPVGGLRDLVVSFTSAFANFQAGGKSLATLQGDGNADLAKARQQVAQIIDLGQLQLAGRATFTLASHASTADASMLRTELKADLNALKIGLPDRPPIELALARAGMTADLVTDPQGLSIKQVTTATASLLAGESERQPLIDTAVTLSGVDVATQRIARLVVSKCNVPSLRRLQQFIDPFLPTLREQKIELADGSLDAVIEASDIDPTAKKVNLTKCEITLPKLRVVRGGQELVNDTVRVALAATAAGLGDGVAVDVTTLSLASALATIDKADGLLRVESRSGLARGTGTLNVVIDVVSANRLARTFSGNTSVPHVTAGRFDGRLAMSNAPGKNATAGFSGTLAGLTLADTPVQNEAYTIDINAAVTPAFDHIDAGVRLRGDYFSVIGKNIAAKMPATNVSPQQMIETASFDVGVKDLAKAQTVLAALVPGLKMPLRAAGGLSVQANVTNGVVTADLTASRLNLRNDAGKAFAFDLKKPITLKLAATLQGSKAIDGLRITRLDGDLDVATVAMNEPIIVSGLTTTPTAQGKITLAGSFQRVLPLLAVLQQAERPLPYAGQFSFTQTVGPERGAIALQGTGTIDDFAVLDDRGRPTFEEKRVTVTNELTINPADEIAAIKWIHVDMTSSKAATIAINGGVENWSAERRLKNVIVKVDAIGQKVWPILYAMMPEAQQLQFKDAKLTGPIRIEMTANGAYPVRPTWNESIRTVEAHGGMSIAGVDTMGLAVENFVLPFSLVDNGKFITGDVRKKGAARFAKPFTVNGGQGDLGSIVLELGDPDLRLSIGRRQKLLQKVQLNPVLASQLGSLASVVFKDAKEASGLIDLTVQECQGVRLLELMNKQATASFVYSVHDLKLDGPVPSTLSRVLNWGDGGILGDIDGATLSLKKGIAQQDMTVALQRQGRIRNAENTERKRGTVTETIVCRGGIDLTTNKFADYKMTLSEGLLLKDWRKSFPDGATVDLRGRVDDVGGVLAQAIGQLAVQGYGGDAIDKLLGGIGKKPKER